MSSRLAEALTRLYAGDTRAGATGDDAPKFLR